MAWHNILSIPGLTYSILYREFAAGGGFDFVPTHPLTVSGGQFVLDADGDWDVGFQVVAIEITSFGSAVMPAAARFSVTDIASNGWEQDTYGFGLEVRAGLGGLFGSGFGHVGNPYTGFSDLAATVSDRYFVLNPGYAYAFASGALKIELDTELAVPDFWTGFDNTFEDETLQKPLGLVYDPGHLGQEYVAPYEVCTEDHGCQPGPGVVCPAPGNPPGPGTPPGSDPPGAGSGPGSGPPAGDNPNEFCVTVVNSDGSRERCCRAGPGAPVVCTPI